MDKLELDLDDLNVDSFRAELAQGEDRGTVQGQQAYCPTEDHACDTDEVTCEGGVNPA